MGIFVCARVSGDLLVNADGDAPARYISKELKMWKRSARADLAEYKEKLKGILLMYGASGRKYKREITAIFDSYKKCNKINIMEFKNKLKDLKKKPQGEEKLNEFRRVRKEYRKANKQDFKTLQDKCDRLVKAAIESNDILNKNIQKERGDDRFKLVEERWVQRAREI